MSTHTYKFNIGMSCGGCSGAVERVLKKLDGELSPLPPPPHGSQPRMPEANCTAGVESYTVSLETQTAEVIAAESLDYDTVLEKIKKTGKKVKSGEADGEAREV
jgi:copper chaperone